MHIHIIGICGTFMGGLAALAREAGYRVTGCDAQVYPPMSTQLAALGIEMVEGFEAEQLEQFPADIFVIGNVAKRGMPVIEAILNRKLPYRSGPQWLAEHILQKYQVIAVAGTHGKTTTSSMLAWILEFCGKAPGFLIGGVPENFAQSARLPKNSPYFVIEADEYDTAFFDKRSKFLHYQPRVAVLNNLEFDHADIFPDLAAIETQFHHWIRTIPSEGHIILSAGNDALSRVLARGVWTPRIYFGENSAWHVADVSASGAFAVAFGEQILGRVDWTLMGEHNRANALAAIAAASALGISAQDACAALSAFAGVKRRMEVRGVVRGVTVYDDFAHHPSAIALTLQGLRARLEADKVNDVPAGKIFAVLEPRSNTMKLGTMKEKLAESLIPADRIFCFAPSHLDWQPQDALSSLGSRAQVFADLTALVQSLGEQAQAGDHIVIMSNGGFGGIHEQVLRTLKEE